MRDYLATIKLHLTLSKIKTFDKSTKIEFPARVIGVEYIEFGENVSIKSGMKLRAFQEFNGQKYSPKIRIGSNVSIEHNCHIGCIDEVSIGENVLIASNVFISDHMHGAADYSDINTHPLGRILSSKGKIIIESGVWIGENVTILAGVTIGKNSVIGANSVVNSSVPDRCIAAGVPAKVIRQIND